MSYVIGIDTETTGVTSTDAVIQIACIKLDSLTFKELDVFETLVYTDVVINNQASSIHGIYQEHLIGKPDIETIWRDSPILEWSKKAMLVFGHNIMFDLKMLNRKELMNLNRLDTLTLVRFLYPNWVNHKLSTCVQNLKLPQRKSHNALGDIESCADILRHVSQHHKLTIEDMFIKTNKLQPEIRNILKKLGR